MIVLADDIDVGIAALDDCFDFDTDEFDAALVNIDTEEEAKELLGSAYMFDIPLAAACSDFSVAEIMAREYCGNRVKTVLFYA